MVRKYHDQEAEVEAIRQRIRSQKTQQAISKSAYHCTSKRREAREEAIKLQKELCKLVPDLRGFSADACVLGEEFVLKLHAKSLQAKWGVKEPEYNEAAFRDSMSDRFRELYAPGGKWDEAEFLGSFHQALEELWGELQAEDKPTLDELEELLLPEFKGMAESLHQAA